MAAAFTGNAGVMPLYYRADVRHATITHFNRTPVKNFMELSPLWEVPINQQEEFAPYVGYHVLAERRVKPYDFFFLCLALRRWLPLHWAFLTFMYLPLHCIRFFVAPRCTGAQSPQARLRRSRCPSGVG